MGVDCKITLPPATRARDVVKVLGILAGTKPYRYDLGNTSWAAGVEGANLFTSGVDGLVRLRWDAPEGQPSEALYHFEWGPYGRNDLRGCRGLMPRSTPWWCAVAVRLVDFFGGEVDFNDCDDSDCDYSVPWREDCSAEDGEEWRAFQQRLMDLQPLTPEEIDAARAVAAYD
jgi:hypothetical protein